jgi:methylthioribulose-1-phosphate dehydratase
VDSLARQLVDVVRRIHAAGLATGTGGNFSAALDDRRLVITGSGLDKGTLDESQLVVVDHVGARLEGTGKPSAETGIHIEFVRARGARAVLHVHSVWNTLLSQRFVAEGALAITGLEMLKGLRGVTTHEHREIVPVLANSQDIPALVVDIRRALDANPACHGLLIAGHGLYTWGSDLAEAHRHVEIFEFLFEVVGRQLFGR